MNERNALIPISNDPIENSSKNFIRKRKAENVSGHKMSKSYKDNYYYVLDEQIEEFNKNVTDEFEQYVRTNSHNDHSENPVTVNNNYASEKESATGSDYTQRENNANQETNSIRNPSLKNNKNVPPINVFDIESKRIIKLIKDGLKIKQFKIKQLKVNKLAIYLSNLDEYKIVRGYLQKTEIKFFSYTPKELKTKTFLLKGLNANTDCNEICDELNLYQNDQLKIIKVTQFSTKNSAQKNVLLPIFMVQISPESNVKELKAIKTLLYHCITWDTLRKPEISQCRNCQSLFHSAANCNLPPKCVKCSESHKTKDCPIPKETPMDKEKLFCVLCKKYGHPASYKGCEVYKQLLEKIRQKKNHHNSKQTSIHIKLCTPHN